MREKRQPSGPKAKTGFQITYRQKLGSDAKTTAQPLETVFGDFYTAEAAREKIKALEADPNTHGKIWSIRRLSDGKLLETYAFKAYASDRHLKDMLMPTERSFKQTQFRFHS